MYSLVITVDSEKRTNKILFHSSLLEKILRLISLYSIIISLFLSYPSVTILNFLEGCSEKIANYVRVIVSWGWGWGEAHNSAVGKRTALQTGRHRFRFPMGT